MIEIVLEVAAGMIVLTGGAGIAAAASGKGDKPMSTRPKAPPPRPPKPELGFDPFLAALESQVRENARLYAAVPTASWLAPDEIDARFAPAPVADRPIPAKYQAPIVLPPSPPRSQGTWINPEATMRVAKPDPLYRAPPPPCPGCGRSSYAEIDVTAEHDGEQSMWQCQRCNTEYTKAGETKASKKRQKAARRLPCGCTGEVTTRSYPSAGFDMGRYAVCLTCDGTWDYAPKMDDTGDPRKMHLRSGPVEWPNGRNYDHSLPLPPAMG